MKHPLEVERGVFICELSLLGRKVGREEGVHVHVGRKVGQEFLAVAREEVDDACGDV